ncbi:hypothetical protein [Pseudomonas viridiflava]|uniref:hypothetical protein n=1 Tax=Pseudomonas viridiflava TaxID=33069 RepID=UPI000F030B72|nr:hypothetical protein [Pseudomonas viridiflava]
MIAQTAEPKMSFPYPIYLNGMHIEEDRTLASRRRQDYQNGNAFNLILSDISWMVDLEATLERMQRDIPQYPESFYLLHLAESVAFALCVEHEKAQVCLELLMSQQCTPKMLLEVASIAQRMQRRDTPDGHQWIRPADTAGNLRDVRQMIELRLVTESDMVDRAFEHPEATKVVQDMINAVDKASADRMRQKLVRHLLESDQDEAPKLREMLGLQAHMSLWEASRRFTLMFEYAAYGLVDEHQLLPTQLSAHPDQGIALQIRMLMDERPYLNDMAQKDLPRVLERILLEAVRFPHIADVNQPPLHHVLIAQAIEFSLNHVRDGENLIMHALLPNKSMGEMYCPAPWEQTAREALKDLLSSIEPGLKEEGRDMRVLHQIGRLIIPEGSL